MEQHGLSQTLNPNRHFRKIHAKHTGLLTRCRQTIASGDFKSTHYLAAAQHPYGVAALLPRCLWG